MSGWFIKAYIQEDDEVCQHIVNEETARKAASAGAEVQTQPFDGLPIRSRFRSEREAAKREQAA